MDVVILLGRAPGRAKERLLGGWWLRIRRCGMCRAVICCVTR